MGIQNPAIRRPSRATLSQPSGWPSYSYLTKEDCRTSRPGSRTNRAGSRTTRLDSRTNRPGSRSRTNRPGSRTTRPRTRPLKRTTREDSRTTRQDSRTAVILQNLLVSPWPFKCFLLVFWGFRMLLERPKAYLKALENDDEAPGLLWEAPARREIHGSWPRRPGEHEKVSKSGRGGGLRI